MKDLFTLISYRPSEYDNRSSSDFDIEISDSIDDIAEVWARRMYQDRIRSRSVLEWECTLLINGDNGNWSQDGDGYCIDIHKDLRDQIKKLANVKFGLIVDAYKAQKEAEEKRAADALAAANERTRIEKEQKERALYLKLKEKYADEVWNTPKTLEEKVKELLSSDSYEFDDGA